MIGIVLIVLLSTQPTNLAEYCNEKPSEELRRACVTQSYGPYPQQQYEAEDEVEEGKWVPWWAAYASGSVPATGTNMNVQRDCMMGLRGCWESVKRKEGLK